MVPPAGEEHLLGAVLFLGIGLYQGQTGQFGGPRLTVPRDEVVVLKGQCTAVSPAKGVHLGQQVVHQVRWTAVQWQSHQQQEDQSCNKRQLLWQMNRYRSSHRVPAFILDEGSILAVYMALADVVASMYNSSRWYRWYGGEPPREVLAEFGVFTQLVWYGSRYLAVGCAYNRRDGQREMVLGFSPAGNVVGGYARNVFPPAYQPGPNNNGDGGNVTPDRNTVPNDDDRRVPDDNQVLPYYATLKAQFLAGNSKFDPPEPPVYFTLVHKIFRPDQDGSKVAEEIYQMGADYPFYCKEPPEEARQKYSQFTQLIWRSTKHIAIGCDDNQKTGERHSAIITSDEPGNQKGDYTNNVLPHEGCN
ncbi:CRISP protein, partial [Tyrophagus putrescentiae]